MKNILIFKSLQKFSIKHGLSWGEGARNMSEAFDDPNVIEARVANFLKDLEIPPSKIIVKINPNDNPFGDSDILEINKNVLKRRLTDSGEIEVGANSIFTKEKDIVLIVKPADCAICVWYGENKAGEKYVGLIHCSAKETDKLIAGKTVELLEKNYKLSHSSIYIGITPAISKDYYFVDKRQIDQNNWTGFMEKRGNKIFLDILGNVKNQLNKAGIISKNIESYQLDTFSNASEGKTFSHRLSSMINFPEGRYIVAISIN